MPSLSRTIFGAVLTAVGAAVAGAAPQPKEVPMSLHEITVQTLDGKPLALSTFKGKVLLVVNTASECGFTPQYAGLEKLYETMKGRGVEILGFPSNDFGAQEPGSAQQIKAFCTKNYGVTFPMFEKVVTKGPGASPVFKLLGGADGANAPKWNFHKYVIGKDGKLKKTFPSKVTPESAELRDALEAALKE
jgi:glutathione peroxidase